MKVVRNPEILWREEDDARAEALVGLDRGDDVAEVGTSVLFSDGTMLSLNILGTEIWKRCDGRPVDEVLADLAEVFDVDPDVLRQDAAAFLAELQLKGFIHYEE